MKKIDELLDFDVLPSSASIEEIRICTDFLKKTVFRELADIVRDNGEYKIRIKTHFNRDSDSENASDLSVSVFVEVWEET